MLLSTKWATLEDFATLFHYLWYRDFPVDPISTGGKRADWTIHIGVVVRSIADLMGLAARFESGGRTDAVLRSRDGDEFAVEWEWNGVWGEANNELDKLESPRKNWKKPPKYSVLVTYTHTPNIEKVYERVRKKWENSKWPLLLILIDLEESGDFSSGKRFNNIQLSLFDKNGRKELHKAQAFPWEVEGTRWCPKTE